MARNHGRNDFLIVNEGIFEPNADGLTGSLRRPSPIEEIRKFRFSRINPNPNPKRTSLPLIEALATAMTSEIAPNVTQEHIPAGFTYFGQFVDHDLTQDKTAKALGEDVTVDELLQGRSPSLDLDSLYGRGPLREPQFYQADHVRLKTGSTSAVAGTDPIVAVDIVDFDLPRVGSGSSASERRLANIPDRRNDENLPVAQTHNAFIRFHNRVVDTLSRERLPLGLFERARAEVTKHYQWVIRHDFLPRIIDKAVLDDVFKNGRSFFEVAAARAPKKPGEFFPALPSPERFGSMPIEFSVAAYRLGHSMIRREYNWNRVFRNGGVIAASLPLLFRFSGTSGNLSPEGDFFTEPNSGRFERLPSNWIADWRRLYDFPTDAGRADLAAPEGKPNLARTIDTLLVDPLKNLPTGAFGAKIPADGTSDGLKLNLAFRNLVRGAMVGLSTGQQLASQFEVPLLTADEILQGNAGVTLSLTDALEKELTDNTPLWFYLLREAEVKASSKTLGPLGSRIVAETFHRAMETSLHSIVRDPTWRPTLGAKNDGTFKMVDLLLFAFENNPALLNPVG